MPLQVKSNGVRSLGNLFASVGPEQLSRLTKIIIFVTYTTILLVICLVLVICDGLVQQGLEAMAHCIGGGSAKVSRHKSWMAWEWYDRRWEYGFLLNHFVIITILINKHSTVGRLYLVGAGHICFWLGRQWYEQIPRLMTLVYYHVTPACNRDWVFFNFTIQVVMPIVAELSRGIS